MQDVNTRNRVALVTGAQQGIGRAIAVALAADGADIAVNFLDDKVTAEAVAASVRKVGRRAITVQGDVSVPATAVALVEATCTQLGGIDVLVNNAGVFPRTAFLRMREDEFDHVLGVNLKGSFFCAQAAAQAMVAAGQPGVIINMASQSIRGASPRSTHYTASKGGIVALTRAMALELAPHRIRVHAIAPGLTDTAQPRYGFDEAELAEMARSLPIGRMAQPEDIAGIAVFLASERAAFMSGQTVHANGGTYMP